MKTNSNCKSAAKPLKIHKSCDPTWVRWSVSVPGFTDTQWFKTPQAAAKFAAEFGYVAIEEQTSRISKSEHAALVAVAEAANELQHSENSTTSVMGVSVVKQPLMTVLREKLAALAAARQQSPTPS